MTRIFASIVETTPEKAIEAIRAVTAESVGIEVRVDAFDPGAAHDFDATRLRSASSRPMIYTRRSVDDRPGPSVAELERAIEAGFDLADVELDGDVAIRDLPADRRRFVLSLHDYEGVPDLDREIDRMEASGIPNLKIAVTPRSFEEDRTLLERLTRYGGDRELTLFGMGPNGLYSRTLAPFLGSRLSFVAVDERRSAAPGQLTLERALQSWIPLPKERPDSLFAVVGSPARHSQSPRIHNARFRETGVSAAYGIIETDSIVPVLDAMERNDPCAPRGLSVTAPFKVDLFREASRRGWEMTDRAERADTANTVARVAGRFVVDCTDVLGFGDALDRRRDRSHIAILGAGGTARAAIAALDRRAELTIFNRTLSRAKTLAAPLGARARMLDSLGSETFDVMIDTLPAAAGYTGYLSNIEPNGLLIRASYGGNDDLESQARKQEIEVFGALDLLEAQAREQSRLFIEAAGGTK